MKCPKCGGHLTDEPGNEFLVCDDCGEMFEPGEQKEQAAPNDQGTDVDDMTQEFAKLSRVKVVVIAIAIVLTACLVGVVLYGINRYDKANDYKYSVKQSDLIEKANSNNSREELTTEIMREDYENYYTLRYESGRAFLIIGGAAVGIAFVWAAAIVIIEIAAARILRRATNKVIIMTIGLPAVLIVLGFTLFTSYMLLSNPASPKKATFDVFEMDYLGSRWDTVQSFHNGHPSKRIYYKMSYEKDGQKVTVNISEFEYKYVYPGTSGKYYVSMVDGKTFHFYPTSEYSYK
ncbi:MAG: TFIIB-type zinc ribbon-containing protein [Clostridiales bacterium]|nr:TFIIB-type zinc ribbon-containing protein [Clostridiales bacterium]